MSKVRVISLKPLIAGNKYRLIARIRYDYQLINVRSVLTHQEYDRRDWKE